MLVQNPETRRWLPRRHRERAEQFPNVVLDITPTPRRRDPAGPPTAAYAGDLLPLKGVALALRTIALLPGWRLLVAGAGPDEPRLRRLAAELGLQDRVQFLGWVPRDQLLKLLRDEVDVFLFPSLRDQAPWAVAEARALGLPVVCLDVGGPPLLGGRAVARAGPAGTVRALAEAVAATAADGPPPPAAGLRPGLAPAAPGRAAPPHRAGHDLAGAAMTDSATVATGTAPGGAGSGRPGSSAGASATRRCPA